MKVIKSNKKKEITFLEKKRKKNSKKNKILKITEINLEKKNKKTKLEEIKFSANKEKQNTSTDQKDLFTAFDALSLDLKQSYKINSISSKSINREKKSFKEIKNAISNEGLSIALANIYEISKINDKKTLNKKISEIKTKTQDLQNIIAVLDSLILSFDNEFENEDYKQVIFSFLEEKIKTFPTEIIKNILETKCNEIISILLTDDENKTSSKKQNILIEM